MRLVSTNRFVPLVLGIMLFLGESVFATNFYFDNRLGNDAHDGRSISLAWKSFQNLNKQLLKSGDTVFLAAGSVWKDETLRLGKIEGLAAPIVITSYPLQAEVLPKIVTRGTGILVDSSSNLVISAIAVEGAEKACIEIAENSKTIQVAGVEVSKCGIGVKVSGRDISLKDSYLSNMHMIRNTQGKAKTREANDDYGAIGVVLKNVAGCLIQNNSIQKCRAQSYDYGFDGGAVEIWKSVKSCEIRGNRSNETDGFLEIGGSQADSVVDVYVHHNFAREVGSFSWIHGQSADDVFGLNYRNIHFYHNTAITWGRPTGYFIGIGGPRLTVPQIFASNNLILSEKLGATYINDGGIGGGKNLFWSNSSKDLHGKVRKGDIWARPSFVDSAKNDFRLVRNTPGARGGMPLAKLPGTGPRKGQKVSIPDIGSFEDFQN